MGAGEEQPGLGEPSAADRGTASRNDPAEKMGRLARDLQRSVDFDQVVDDVVSSAVNLVPGAEVGSISVVIGRRRVTSQAASDPMAEHADAVQEEVGQGPCLDAVFEQKTIRVTDMASESRWPLFAARAAELGARSMLSLQLFVQGDTLGALNLFAREPGAFTDDSEQVGLLLASHAAVAFAGARHTAHMRSVTETRDVIGQAKGILMERRKIGSDEAFAVLARTSQTNHRRLRDVAEELCLSGELPAPV